MTDRVYIYSWHDIDRAVEGCKPSQPPFELLISVPSKPEYFILRDQPECRDYHFYPYIKGEATLFSRCVKDICRAMYNQTKLQFFLSKTVDGKYIVIDSFSLSDNSLDYNVIAVKKIRVHL